MASLSTSPNRTEAVEKLCRVCQVLHDVATLYVDAKQQAQEEGQGMLPIGNEVDMYLSTLGLVPGSVGAEENLADWFSGNRQMMGLLEEDFMNWSGVP